jgi:hypothetical protein
VHPQGRLSVEVKNLEQFGVALTALAHDDRIEAKGVRKDLKEILLSGRESDSHGLPMIRKPFLQDELERVMRRERPALLTPSHVEGNDAARFGLAFGRVLRSAVPRRIDTTARYTSIVLVRS